MQLSIHCNGGCDPGTRMVRFDQPIHSRKVSDEELHHTDSGASRSYVVQAKVQSSSNSILQGPYRGTVFLTPNATTVFAQIGGTANLPCIVRKFSNGVVSWIRKDDVPPTILTVGLGAYIAGDRFFVEHARHSQNWGLVIKHVQLSDAGTYECQVSLHPTTSIFIELKVTEAIAEISGAPDLHIRAGSRLRIVCKLRHNTEPPAYVFWYHDDRMINHDPGVRVTIDKATVVLLIEVVNPNHSGNYTCYPSNATPSYVNVHVLNATEEEYPAAMMHSCGGESTVNIYTFSWLVLWCMVVLQRRDPR